MKESMKRLLALTCTVLLVVSMIGCAKQTATSTETKDAQTTDSKPDETKESAESTKSTGDEIEFWTVFTGPDGDSMTKMVEEYNNTNPKIKVVHRPIEAGDLYAKLPTLAQTGVDVPDLAIIHIERLPLFAEAGMLTPLDGYIAANGTIKAEDYVPTAWNKAQLDGKQYGVPLDVHSFVTYYNKDLLAKYGPNVLDDGAITFEEVEQVGALAEKDGIVGMGITWMRVKALAWYAQLGGKLSEDGTTPSFNNEKFAKVLNTVKDLHDKGYTSVDGDDPMQLFSSGQMVFWPEGIWMKNNLVKIDTLNFGMTQFIQFDPAIRGNWTSSHQMVMIKNPQMTDERAAAIMDFVAWVGANSIEWARAGQNPACLKILENAEYKEMGQSFLLDDTDSLVIHDYKYYGYAVEALDKIVVEVPFGRMTAEEGLAQAEKETADRIKAGE